MANITSERILTKELFSPVVHFAFCGSSVALGLSDRSSALVSVDQLQFKYRDIHRHRDRVVSVDCARNGERFASVSDSGGAVFVSEAGETSLSIPGWTRVAYLDDGNLLAAWAFENRGQHLSTDGKLLNGNDDASKDATILFDGLSRQMIWSNKNYTQSDVVGYGGGRFFAVDEKVAIRVVSTNAPDRVARYGITSQVEGMHVLADGGSCLSRNNRRVLAVSRYEYRTV